MQSTIPEVAAENILNRDFTANAVNEKWCTDITEIKYGSEGGKAYLSAILDLKGRDIVSFAIGKNNNNQFVFKPLICNPKIPRCTSSVSQRPWIPIYFKSKLNKQGIVMPDGGLLGHSEMQDVLSQPV